MVSPIPLLYFPPLRFVDRRPAHEPFVGGGTAPNFGGCGSSGGTVRRAGATGARLDNVSKVSFTERERSGTIPR
jgi:hypothetical protein